MKQIHVCLLTVREPKTHVPLGTVISCPRWPPRSLGLDFTPCHKKAPPNERPRLDGRRYSILHSTRARLARQNVYWTLVSVLKGFERKREGKRGPRTIIWLRAQNPPGDDDLKPERLPKGTKADDDRCDAVR